MRRLAGVINENLAVLLMAAEAGVPVCPHAGGVRAGAELVQHLSVLDYVCVSGSLDGRTIEYVDHLHEHFLDPVAIRSGALHAADAAWVQRGDARRVAVAVSVPRRRRVGGRSGGRRGHIVRRFGQVIGVRPGRIEEYERLHANAWPGVLEAIRRANIRNYSIYRHDDRLFAYFEYAGDDFEGDMATMAADPVVREWWSHTDAMQEPFEAASPASGG